MTTTRTRFMRIALCAQRRIREAAMIAKAWDSPRRPILVHIIPVRRCNLSCTYCNEYDDFSKPVPTAEMVRRIDLLAALGSLSVHLSGGEPLLHPDLDRILRHAGLTPVAWHGGFSLGDLTYDSPRALVVAER